MELNEKIDSWNGSKSEEILIKAALGGSKAALARLVKNHYDFIYIMWPSGLS